MGLKFIKWFSEISIHDILSVGGKTASLGEMYRNLQEKGIAIPNGFGVTASGYRLFLSTNQLEKKISEILKDVNLADTLSLQKAGDNIRTAMMNADMPKELETEILDSYKRLIGNQPNVTVAVRSSATAEDLPQASFAGQQETFLNVVGEKALLTVCKNCFASLFTDRAISYRRDMGFNQLGVELSLCIQLMIRSDLGASGVMFSLDTETGFKDVVLINSSYGLGESIVQGTVNPDEFYVFKTTLKMGKKPIIQKRLGSKEHKLIYESGGTKMTKSVPVPIGERQRFSITDEDILQLARWACLIEDYYSQIHEKWTPMDIEWGKDGLSGKLFILQARPETVKSQEKETKFITYQLQPGGIVLLTGRSVGEKIAKGPVRVIKNAADLAQLNRGEVLVTSKTDPDWEPAMKLAAAIVTERGGRTCHAAIVSRELGLPAVVGAEEATNILTNGQEITVSCAEGEIGKVYSGYVPYTEQVVDHASVSQERPKTAIMMNVAKPEDAIRLSQLPNDGVGLARIEFIISNHVKIHPLALIHFDQLGELSVRQKIENLTQGFSSKPQYFVERLAQGVAMLAAAFYPKPVIVRFSDFKTNEYANLIGGKNFEPQEENPMIGFRGASRYYSERYRVAFGLECQAITKVRGEMGLTNVKVMIPFCRTVDEGKKVLKVMKDFGLERGANNLEVYVMCEIPSNVILADQFAEIFDGFSIGSNDLTQLTLGIDRDSELLSSIFDERNEAVKRTICEVIRKAKVSGKKIGICGQAPSDYPEFAEFLVREGIDSISLNPDSLIKTTLAIRKIEEQQKQ